MLAGLFRGPSRGTNPPTGPLAGRRTSCRPEEVRATARPGHPYVTLIEFSVASVPPMEYGSMCDSALKPPLTP